MSKTEFTILVDEVLNEFNLELDMLNYNDDGICKVSYTDGIYDKHFYVPYRFMNRARLRMIIMDEEDLLTLVDPELDLGF